MQRFMRLGVLVLVAAVMAGCEDKKKAEEAKNPPPRIRTQGEIAGEFQPAYAPLRDSVASGTDLPRDAGTAIAATLSSAKAKNAAEENGPPAIAQVTSDLEDIAKGANDKALWGTVVSTCDALAAMDPSNPKIARYKDRAILQLNRPVVTITGSTKIPSQSDKTIFFLDVFLPEKNKKESVKVSVGEEFLGLRFVEVVGNDEGIKFEYVAVGDTFVVKRSR